MVANLIDHPGRGSARPLVVEEQDPVTGGDDVGPEVEARMALQVPVRPVGGDPPRRHSSRMLANSVRGPGKYELVLAD